MVFYGMALGDVWKTKLVIEVTVEASSEQRAQQRWENVLEKVKYQTPHVIINVPLSTNWQKVEKETDDDVS